MQTKCCNKDKAKKDTGNKRNPAKKQELEHQLNARKHNQDLKIQWDSIYIYITPGDNEITNP